MMYIHIIIPGHLACHLSSVSVSFCWSQIIACTRQKQILDLDITHYCVKSIFSISREQSYTVVGG